MMRALYTAATGMHAQETRMSVSANNLANANTTGFKRARTEFEDLLSETVRTAEAPDPRGGTRAAPLEIGLGVKAGATTRSFAQGDMMATQNSLDVAIEGKGFLRVLRPTGDLAYTRAGNLRVDGSGRLVTQTGHLIDPPIQVPDDATDITIGTDGQVSARVPGREDSLPLGQLELTVFQNSGALHALGGNLFEATEATGRPQQVRPGEQGSGTLAQGFLEGANVSTVEEMIGLISTQRAYELNSRVISTADEMLQRLGQL